MKMVLLRTDIRMIPESTVEIIFTVDNKTVRVSVDWTTIEHFMGGARLDEAAVAGVPLDQQSSDRRCREGAFVYPRSSVRSACGDFDERVF